MRFLPLTTVLVIGACGPAISQRPYAVPNPYSRATTSVSVELLDYDGKTRFYGIPSCSWEAGVRAYCRDNPSKANGVTARIRNDSRQSYREVVVGLRYTMGYEIGDETAVFTKSTSLHDLQPGEVREFKIGAPYDKPDGIEVNYVWLCEETECVNGLDVTR